MSWGIEAVDKLKQQLTTKGERTATVNVDGRRLQMDVEAFGAVGVAAGRMHIRSPKQDSNVDLGSVGRAIAGRVTYLLEPLCLLEVSERRALLRSSPPTMHDDANEYYEFWLERDDDGIDADVHRYRYDKDERAREPIPLRFTWETAGRLLDDVVETVEG